MGEDKYYNCGLPRILEYASEGDRTHPRQAFFLYPIVDIGQQNITVTLQV